eukprot:4458436-Pleurochrysis_carterae.AAC.6
MGSARFRVFTSSLCSFRKFIAHNTILGCLQKRNIVFGCLEVWREIVSLGYSDMRIRGFVEYNR